MVFKAIWQNTLLAESDETVVVEGTRYFPPDSVEWHLLSANETYSICPRKGRANYYDVLVGDAINRDAAWSYADPRRYEDEIRGYVAFWKGVEIVEGAPTLRYDEPSEPGIVISIPGIAGLVNASGR